MQKVARPKCINHFHFFNRHFSPALFILKKQYFGAPGNGRTNNFFLFRKSKTSLAFEQPGG
jgi:hypothetical protein